MFTLFLCRIPHFAVPILAEIAGFFKKRKKKVHNIQVFIGFAGNISPQSCYLLST